MYRILLKYMSQLSYNLSIENDKILLTDTMWR